MLIISKVQAIASRYGYEFYFADYKNKVIGFTKGNNAERVLIHVHYEEHVISTTLTHPVWGKNKLYRRNVTPYTMIRIFENPRLHTAGRGFRKTPLACKNCGKHKCWCSAGDPHFLCAHDVFAHTSLAVPKRKRRSRYVKPRFGPPASLLSASHTQPSEAALPSQD